MIYYVGMKIELNGYKESFISIIIQYLCFILQKTGKTGIGYTYNDTTLTNMILLHIRITSLSMHKRTSPTANTITIYTNSNDKNTFA